MSRDAETDAINHAATDEPLLVSGPLSREDRAEALRAVRWIQAFCEGHHAQEPEGVHLHRLLVDIPHYLDYVIALLEDDEERVNHMNEMSMPDCMFCGEPANGQAICTRCAEVGAHIREDMTAPAPKSAISERDVAAIAGTIASGSADDEDIAHIADGNQAVASYIARGSVALARAIVAEVERTRPNGEDQ